MPNDMERLEAEPARLHDEAEAIYTMLKRKRYSPKEATAICMYAAAVVYSCTGAATLDVDTFVKGFRGIVEMQVARERRSRS